MSPALLALLVLAGVPACAADRPAPERAAPAVPRSPVATPSATAADLRAELREALRTRRDVATSATAVVPEVVVHARPGGPVTHRLENPAPSGAPLTFLQQDRQGAWVQVLLPVRPNGSSGWVRASDVRLRGLRYEVEVHVAEHRLVVLDRGTPLREHRIGVGTADTPTPGGTFYLKELIRPRDPDGPYGPYAYGLSGFSNQLTEYDGGEGVIGIHGTDDPSGVGRDVSHGCIRLTNADITALADLLPLGTPVRVLA